MTDTNKSTHEAIDGLINELLDVINKYAGTLFTTTALGCLEVAKAHLIQMQLDSMQYDEDEDDD